MKRFYHYIAFVLLASACSDNISDYGAQTLSMNAEKVAYPYRDKMNKSTRVKTEKGEWENWEKVQLNSETLPVFVPWNETSATTIPIEIRKDIKAVDGWELIAHTVNGFGDEGLNYLIFHNRFTGIMKVFYYNESESPNNSGIWKIRFESEQSFLAFEHKYAKDASDKSVQDFYVGNLTNDDTKGFASGWNCFQFELAFDPDFRKGSLQFIPYSLNNTTFQLSGELSTETIGIISSSGQDGSSGIIKGIARGAGTDAEKWVKTKLDKGEFKKVSSMISGGVKGLVEKGVGSLLGSFVGGFSSSSGTTQQVLLQTSGEITANGVLTNLSTGYIKPLSFSISKEDVGSLGAWTVTKTPILYFRDRASYYGLDEQKSENTYIYTTTGIRNTNINSIVKINPDILPYVKNYSFSYDIYQSSEISFPTLDAKGAQIYYECELTDQLYKNTYSEWGGLCKFPVYMELTPHESAPSMIVISEHYMSDYGFNTYMRFGLRSHYIVVITLKMEVENNGETNTIVSSHTFIPFVNWEID